MEDVIDLKDWCRSLHIFRLEEAKLARIPCYGDCPMPCITLPFTTTELGELKGRQSFVSYASIQTERKLIGDQNRASIQAVVDCFKGPFLSFSFKLILRGSVYTRVLRVCLV